MTEGRLAVTVDLEDWYHLPAVTGAPTSRYGSVEEFFDSWDGRYDYLTEPTHRVLDIFDRMDLKATFFAVADICDNYPGLIEEVAARGHEVECHGLHHICPIDPSTKEPLFFEEEYGAVVSEAKEKLEDASGREVTGFRAPNAYVAGWVLDVLDGLGFQYDSSVVRNSLYNKTDSPLREVGSRPYRPASGGLVPGGGRTILELPWPYYEVAGLKLPAAGGPLLRLLGWRYVYRGLRQSLKRGDAVFYFHPLDIAEDPFPVFGRKRHLFWINRGARTERRVLKLLDRVGNETDLVSAGEIVSAHRRSERTERT